MDADARLPRQAVKGVAGIGIEREGIDPQPGIAAGLLGALPIVVDVADRRRNRAARTCRGGLGWR